MFRKILTTVNHNGKNHVSVQNLIAPGEVEADIAATTRTLRQSRSYGRVASVEKTMTTLVVLYTSGTVEIFQWVAE